MWFLQWWRRRWGSTGVVPPAPVFKPPSPTRLAFPATATILAFPDAATLLAFSPTVTTLTFIADDGTIMSTPLIFTAGTTGAITLTCTGADGSAENLSTALAVVFTMQSVTTGAVPVNGVALTGGTSAGTATWTRLSAQVQTPDDYMGQVKVTRGDGTVGFYPDARAGTSMSGAAITLLKPVGS